MGKGNNVHLTPEAHQLLAEKALAFVPLFQLLPARKSYARFAERQSMRFMRRQIRDVPKR